MSMFGQGRRWRIRSGTLAARPAITGIDCYYWATDVEELYRYTITGWQLIANPPSPLRPHIVGNWYRSLNATYALGAAAGIAPNILRATAYPVNRTATYDRIGIETTVAEVGTFVRLGIYNDNGAGYPGTLLLDAGAVNINLVGILAIVISQQLIGGRLYWLAVLSDNTGVAQFRWESGYTLSILGHTTQIRGAYGSYIAVQAYGALPDPYPAGATAEVAIFAEGLRLASIP